MGEGSNSLHSALEDFSVLTLEDEVSGELLVHLACSVQCLLDFVVDVCQFWERFVIFGLRELGFGLDTFVNKVLRVVYGCLDAVLLFVQFRGDLIQGGLQLSQIGSVFFQWSCLLYTSPSPRDQRGSRMPSSA